MASRDTVRARRSAAIRITDEIAIHQTEIEERFVRASGRGGQHVNKVSTAVELRVDIAGSIAALISSNSRRAPVNRI